MAREPYRGYVSMLVTKEKGYYDFVLDNAGRVTEIIGAAEIAQAARLRLELWRGGWCLDPQHGFPWVRFVGRKDVTPELMRMHMLDVILRDERIRRVTKLDIEEDPQNRVWVVTFGAITVNGEELTARFSIPWWEG